MSTASSPLRKGVIVPAAVFVLIIVDTGADAIGATHALQVSGGQTLLTWAFAALITVVMVGAEPFLSKHFYPRAEAAVVDDTDGIDIDPSILRRWDSLLYRFGIDYDEPRAQITQFPGVLAQIEVADQARQGCSIRSIRVELGNQVDTLMRETLAPLAAELRYNGTASRPLPVSPAQSVRDAAAELTARTPI